MEQQNGSPKVFSSRHVSVILPLLSWPFLSSSCSSWCNNLHSLSCLCLWLFLLHLVVHSDCPSHHNILLLLGHLWRGCFWTCHWLLSLLLGSPLMWSHAHLIHITSQNKERMRNFFWMLWINKCSANASVTWKIDILTIFSKVWSTRFNQSNILTYKYIWFFFSKLLVNLEF